MLKNENIGIDDNEMDNIKFLRKLQENVAKLDKLEQYEIFKIIKTYNNKLTENKNGIFINLSSLDKTCIIKINNFINYSLDNRKRLNNMEALSQNIFKNSILNHEYKNYDTSQNNNIENLANLKSKNDKNKDTKIKDLAKNNNKMDEDQVMINLELTDDGINLEREYNLYQQNIDNEDISVSGIINELNKETREKEESKEDISNLDREENFLSKKTKFTGKRGRIFKKCKENSKNINLNSITSYNNYSENQGYDNDDDDDYSNKINELTEDILE